MLYRRLADLVVVVHALVAVFFLLGAVGGRTEPWIGLFHIPLVLWVCSAYIMGWTCPLTPLEKSLRRAAGERGYEGSFVEHYIARLMGFNPEEKEVHVPTKKERNGQIIIGVALGLMNLVVYGTSWHKYHDALWPPHMKPPEPPATQRTLIEPLNSIGNKPAVSVSDSADAGLPGSVAEDAPDFDPKLTLTWPGTPEESRRRINAGMADETTIYHATLLQSGPGPVTIFEASVYQFTEKDLLGSDPKEMLVGHLASGDEIELTRRQIEHGPNKLLGFDVIVK